jgi:uncharacterized protein (TIGR00255 family)
LLLSMTGHGEARLHEGGLSVTVEVRSVNSRYFKLLLRAGDTFLALEPRVESLVRDHIPSGTVQVSLRVDREVPADRYQVNVDVLAAYCRQLDEFCLARGLVEPIRPDALLGLPGVVDERLTEASCFESDWPLLSRALHEALGNLDAMRRQEGHVMAVDLRANCEVIRGLLEKILARSPVVAETYRDRITERLNKLLGEYDTQVQPADIVREVGMFAERIDVSEELLRLRSHLDQFLAITELDESSGRKLDFLTQEMFREANTIGSKGNDAEIAGHVVDIKAMIERMREMIQNVE